LQRPRQVVLFVEGDDGGRDLHRLSVAGRPTPRQSPPLWPEGTPLWLERKPGRGRQRRLRSPASNRPPGRSSGPWDSRCPKGARSGMGTSKTRKQPGRERNPSGARHRPIAGLCQRERQSESQPERGRQMPIRAPMPIRVTVTLCQA
jgi:hypothetical protein